MPLHLVGAGLGRTGTHSLKLAIERLTGQPCYHMSEVFGKPDHVDAWRAAIVDGTMPDWEQLLAGYGATVDWPACAFWQQLADAYPEAPVLLSERSSADVWWTSMEQTIVTMLSQPVRDAQQAHTRTMSAPLMTSFCPEWPDREAVIDAYERHNDHVRETVPAERLVEWRPGDGWAPLCAALGVAVPDEPFPHVNSTAEFRQSMRQEDASQPT
jgi:sulfotransferase family protein